MIFRGSSVTDTCESYVPGGVIVIVIDCIQGTGSFIFLIDIIALTTSSPC